jgi:ribonucrease Y
MTFGLIGLGALILGAVVGYIYRKQVTEEKNRDLVEKGKKTVQEAEAKSRELLLEARNDALQIQEAAKKEEMEKREQLHKVEERLMQKEETLDKKAETADKAHEELNTKVESVRKLKVEVEELHKQQTVELEKVAGLSAEDAKEILLKKVEAQEDLLAQIQKVEAEMKDQAESRARSLIVDAIQKYAAETSSESTATIVNIPSDDMKGRIIGREGRNITAFEEATGVDVIVDDTPGSIIVSGFDLIRRYIAKMALERLVLDGRIHPARIEETVEKVKEEVADLILELGEKAVFDTGVVGLPPELIKVLGRLKFRVSHGQNVLKHSMEVSFLASSLAAELGADVEVCKMAGLLHDIGKAVDHEVQGHHASIGRDIAKKFGLKDAVVHAIEAHEGTVEAQSIEAVLVRAANLISNARPGANKDNLDNFIKRLGDLEATVKAFGGVRKAYAIQAGNGVQILVDPDKVDDIAAAKLSYDVARKLEQQMQFPGQIKVHVFREVRASETAK